MSYQHISHQSFPPTQGGYGEREPGFFTDPPPPPPPQVGGYDYQPGPPGYNYQAGPPQGYGTYGYPGYYDSRRSPSSLLRACLGALCCCCVLEECCMPW